MVLTLGHGSRKALDQTAVCIAKCVLQLGELALIIFPFYVSLDSLHRSLDSLQSTI